MTESLPIDEKSLRSGIKCLGPYESCVGPVVFGCAMTKLVNPTAEQMGILKRIRDIKKETADFNGVNPPEGATKGEKHDWALKGWLYFRGKLISAALYNFPDNDPERAKYPPKSTDTPQEEKPASRESEGKVSVDTQFIDDETSYLNFLEEESAIQEAKSTKAETSIENELSSDDLQEIDAFTASLDVIQDYKPEEKPSPVPVASSSPSVPSSASNEKSGKFNVEFVEQIMLDEPEPEIIEGVMPAKGVVTIYGADRLGKTFIAVDMASRIAAGMNWHGKHVEQKPVRYFYLEAGGGLKRRLKAWMIEYPDMFPRENIGFIRENSIDIVKDWKEIAALVPKGGVVFIDTLHKSTAGKDENSNTDMGLVLKAAGDLARAIDGLVIIIHHTGKDKNKGMRGAQCLRDDVTGTLAINEKNGVKYIEVEKNKDELAGERYPYYLKVLDTGEKKPTGKPITSCVAIPDTLVNPEDIKPATKENTGPVLRSTAHILAYKALCDLLDQNHGEPVAKAAWRKEYYKLNPIESQNPDGPTEKEKDNHGKTFRNAIASLLAKDMITALDGGYYGKK